MALNELSRIRETLNQDRTARQQNSDSRLSNPAGANELTGGTFLAGERVYDTKSGLHGEAVRTIRENIIVPAPPPPDGSSAAASFQLPRAETVETVYVRLTDGRLVPRAPNELVKRPTLPGAQK